MKNIYRLVLREKDAKEEKYLEFDLKNNRYDDLDKIISVEDERWNDWQSNDVFTSFKALIRAKYLRENQREQREIQKLVDKDYNFLLNKVEKMIEDNNDPLFKIE